MSMDPKDTVVQGTQGDLNEGQGDPGFIRVSPLLDCQTFKKKYLFGVPLKAALTGETIEIEDLKSYISDAIGEVEMTVRIPITPVRITDAFDFKKADDLQFSTRRLTRWPVITVEKLAALWPGRRDGNTADEGQELNFPTNWVSLQGDSGLFSMVPVASDLVSADPQFIHSVPYRAFQLGNMGQWPNMWRITYTAGFPHDRIPHSVNHLIGVIAAINFLSQMGPAIFPMNSVSVGIDGMSQGSGSPGPSWLANRIADLTAERERLTMVLKQHYGTDIQFTVF